MNSHQFGLTAAIVATDQASAVLQKVSGSMNKTKSSTQALAESVRDSSLIMTSMFISSAQQIIGASRQLMAIGWGPLKAAFNISDEAADFQYRLAAVGAITNATAEQMKEFAERARDAAIATQFSPEEAAQGLLALNQAGLGAKNSLVALQPVLDMAEASMAGGAGLTVEEAARLGGQALKAFSLDAKELGHAMDLMASASTKSLITFEELPAAIGILSRGVAATNSNMTDTLGIYAILRDRGLQVERASTAVSVAMEQLARPRARKAMEALGVAVVDTTTGGFRPFLNVLADVGNALENMTEAERRTWVQTTFGTRAATGISLVLSQLGTEAPRNAQGVADFGAAVEGLRKKFGDVGEGLVGFTARARATFRGQLNLFLGSVSVFKEQIATFFSAVFIPVIGKAIQALNWFIGIIREIPDPVKNVLGVLFVVVSTLFGLIVTVNAVYLAWTAVAAVMKVAQISFIGLSAVTKIYTGVVWLLSNALTIARGITLFFTVGIWQMIGAIGVAIGETITWAATIIAKAVAATVSMIAHLIAMTAAVWANVVAWAASSAAVIAAGIAWVAAMIPAAIAVIAALWPVILVIGAIVAAVVLAVKIWEYFSGELSTSIPVLDILKRGFEGMLVPVMSLINGIKILGQLMGKTFGGAGPDSSGARFVDVKMLRRQSEQRHAELELARSRSHGVANLSSSGGIIPVDVTNKTLPVQEEMKFGTEAAQTRAAAIETPPAPIKVQEAAAQAVVTAPPIETGSPRATTTNVNLRSVLNVDSAVVAEVEERRVKWERVRRGGGRRVFNLRPPRAR